jgi:hypothetical protein
MAVWTPTRGTHAGVTLSRSMDGDDVLHGSRAGVHARLEDLRWWLGLGLGRVSGAAANASLHAKVLA